MKRLAALAAVMILLSACGASVEMRDGPAPTAQPAPTPYVIVVQQPAPPQRDDAGALVLLAMCGTAVIGALAAMGAFAFGFNRGKSTVTQAYAPPQLVDPRMIGIGRHVVLSEAEYAALLADAQRRALEVRR